MNKYFMEEIVPYVPDHVRGPLIHTLETATDTSHNRLRALPCSFIPAKPIVQPGAIILGDAFNMRHPLTGGGMSVVLNDVVILRDLLKDVHGTF